MNRKSLDRLLSTAGLVVGALLLCAAFGLSWTHNFIHNQVNSQLAEEKITFPAAGSPGLTSLPTADQTQVSQYAGQQLLTGAQAQVFADHYIAVHLKEIGGGLTYSQLSAQSLANPTDQVLAGKVNLVFRGDTLRGLLLNAYAFDTMATVALDAAYVALIGGLLMFILALLGFAHAGKVKSSRR